MAVARRPQPRGIWCSPAPGEARCNCAEAASITSIDPEAKRVETDAGTFEADFLVIALGADLHPDATPGQDSGVHPDATTPADGSSNDAAPGSPNDVLEHHNHATRDGVYAEDGDALNVCDITRSVGALLLLAPGVYATGRPTGLGTCRIDQRLTLVGVTYQERPDTDARGTRHTWFGRPIALTDQPYIDQTYRYGSTMGGNFQQHQGVEFNNPDGTPVHAVGDGVVVFAGPAEQGANTVAIRHDRKFKGLFIFSTYYHNARLLVSVGQRVKVLGEGVLEAVAHVQSRGRRRVAAFVVHGGMAQNVGPILEMVTEKYLLRSSAEWQGRQEALGILAQVLEALRDGDIARVGAVTSSK